MKLLTTVFFLLALGLSAFASTKNKVTNLPGYSGPALSMYSGYVTVDETNGRNLFYWLVEAEQDAANKPLVLWFQGGPGCSGLNGLLTENGPLRVLPNGTVGYTDITWTKLANMLFLEAPAGVGYSYSNTPSDYNTGDRKTAEDNHKFLQGFLKLFPQYNQSAIWFTGESYGGVYIPTVTELVLQDPVLKPQLQGLMLGNPVFSCQSLNSIATSFNLLYWHGLVGYSHYSEWISAGCNTATTGNCERIYNLAVDEIGEIVQELGILVNQPSLDPDNLYQDFCLGNGTLEFSLDIGYPSSCNSVGSLVSNYLNRRDVQAALGAKPTTWSACTDKLNYQTSGASMVPLYEKFFVQKPSLNILVYSGDIDIMTVPFGNTQVCVNELSGRRETKWQPWFVNGATAGYWEQFSTYTFATIKGAGHEAPTYQPLTSYFMFERFLKSQPLTGDGNHLPKPFQKPLSQSALLRKHGLSY